MFFRFGTALTLVVLTALAGTVFEKKNLQLKRGITRQHYRLQVLQEEYQAQRLLAQQAGAPARLIGALDPALLAPAPHAAPDRPAGSRKMRQSSRAGVRRTIHD